MAETKEQYNLKESIAEIFLNIKDTEMETKCPTCGKEIKE